MQVGSETEAILMLDTKHPTMEGGTGETFDWSVAKAAQEQR
jgi:phosphoribosylanthranilate isomerase